MFTQSILDLNLSQTEARILDASILLADYFYSDRPISKLNLAQAMNEAFGGTDANNCWNWKWAWEALEVAQILFFRRFSLTSLTLECVETILKLCPTHSIRNTEMDKFQQFSTPITLGYLTAIAAGFTPSDRLLFLIRNRRFWFSPESTPF
jgi:hypothetical protein